MLVRAVKEKTTNAYLAQLASSWKEVSASVSVQTACMATRRRKGVMLAIRTAIRVSAHQPITV